MKKAPPAKPIQPGDRVFTYDGAIATLLVREDPKGPDPRVLLHVPSLPVGQRYITSRLRLLVRA